MHLRTLLIVVGLGVASLLPAFAADKAPQSSNSNVRRATRKPKKYKAAKYKAPKKNKKPARAKYGVH